VADSFRLLKRPPTRDVYTPSLHDALPIYGGLEKAALATEKSSFNNGVLQSKGDTLTKIGQQMAKMPIDPRLARMILGGAHFGVLNEVLIIVAALAVQDPRERPADKQMQADQKHALFREADSDFLFYIKLWETLHGNRESMSENKRRTFARNHFLSW